MYHPRRPVAEAFAPIRNALAQLFEKFVDTKRRVLLSLPDGLKKYQPFKKLVDTMTREDEIRQIMKKLGVDRVRAAFIVAIERGEITGDIKHLDEEGNVIRDADVLGPGIDDLD